jgi:putative membrane protein
MKKHLFLTIGTMLLLIGTAGLLRALAGPPRPPAKAASADAEFAVQAARAALSDVELARLAQAKSPSETMRAAAQTIQADRERTAAELHALATAKGLDLPTTTDRTHAAAHARLNALSGAAFNRAWADQMVMDHQAAIDLFTTQSTSGADAEWRAFAAKQLPALRAHLKQAQSLQAPRASGRRASR